MKFKVFILAIVVAFNANAGKPTIDEVTATVDQYGKQMSNIDYQFEQNGDFCSVIVTADKSEPKVDTFTCSRLAAEMMSDRSFVHLSDLLFDQVTTGRLTYKQFYDRLFFAMILHKKAIMVNNKKFGTLE